MQLPETIRDEHELDDVLSTPSPHVEEALSHLQGDLLILGAAGKMGVSLAMLARRAAPQNMRVIAVSRFSNPAARDQLNAAGVDTIQADLLASGALDALPDCTNIIYMVGMKFGSAGQEAKTWAVNAYLAGAATLRFAGARFVLFSTGNVYPFVEAPGRGCAETDPVGPVGEYAQSALGRERIFEYFSSAGDTPGVIYRLNYAIDLRYGVLYDVARSVQDGTPIDLATGYANVIWQGDANAIALRCLEIAETPPVVLNVTGSGLVSIRELARRFGERLGKAPVFEGTERRTALLSDARRCEELFGPPAVSLEQMIGWTADWVSRGGASLNKPTKFNVRSGKF